MKTGSKIEDRHFKFYTILGGPRFYFATDGEGLDLRLNVCMYFSVYK